MRQLQNDVVDSLGFQLFPNLVLPHLDKVNDIRVAQLSQHVYFRFDEFFELLIIVENLDCDFGADFALADLYFAGDTAAEGASEVVLAESCHQIGFKFINLCSVVLI